MGRVEGKVAVVTGGAKGIGAECARLLAREGAKVLLTDVDEEAGCAVAEEIMSLGGSSLFLRQDVTEESSWKSVFKLAEKLFGGLHILVNNAGIAFAKSVEDTSAKDWQRMMSANLDSVFLGTRSGIAAMKATDGPGSIVNISSVEGIVGNSMLAAYNAAKGGVRIFTKSAALHCCAAGYDIRVNSVHPGFIWTPMVEGFLRELGGDAEENLAVTRKLHPMGHLGEPIDVAYGVLYLASDESKFVTGSELVIDGGFTAQ